MKRSELLNACTIWMHRKDKLECLLISKTYPESKKLKAAKHIIVESKFNLWAKPIDTPFPIKS